MRMIKQIRLRRQKMTNKNNKNNKLISNNKKQTKRNRGAEVKVKAKSKRRIKARVGAEVNTLKPTTKA